MKPLHNVVRLMNNLWRRAMSLASAVLVAVWRRMVLDHFRLRLFKIQLAHAMRKKSRTMAATSATVPPGADSTLYSVPVNFAAQPVNIVDGIVAHGGLALGVRGPAYVHDMDQRVGMSQVVQKLVAQALLHRGGMCKSSAVLVSGHRADRRSAAQLSRAYRAFGRARHQASHVNHLDRDVARAIDAFP